MQRTQQAYRPVGVVILIGLALISAVGALLAALSLVLPSPAAGTDGGTVAIALSVGLAGGLIFRSALELVFAISVWSLRPWVWTLGLINGLLSIALAVMGLFILDTVGGHFAAIALSAISLYALFTPNVRVAFGKA